MKLNLKLLILTIFILFGFICFFIFSEWFVYLIVLVQCDWPELDPKTEDDTIENTEEAPLRAMFISDTHLLGSQGYWIDKARTEWEMYMAFQTAIKLHKPEVVFVLGDLTNEGEFCGDDEFHGFVRRFYDTFGVPESTQMHVLVGNHDIGFHYRIQPHLAERFEKGFNSPSAQLITIRSNHFVLVNSVGLEGDGCFLCNSTEVWLEKIETILKCSKEGLICDLEQPLKIYSKPILLQHYPLYRESDANCSEPDEAPYAEKIEKFKEAWDCLSKKATDKLLKQISPRLVIDGHTHHGCTTKLPNGEGIEITIPSFNWRNKDNPSYGLAVFSSNNYAFSKCLMPRQSTALARYALSVVCIIIAMVYWCRHTRILRKRNYFFKV